MGATVGKMAKIPLQRFAGIEFPMTAKSTLHLWAVQGYWQNRGPFAGRITRVGGRWYILETDHGKAVDSIVADIVKWSTDG